MNVSVKKAAYKKKNIKINTNYSAVSEPKEKPTTSATTSPLISDNFILLNQDENVNIIYSEPVTPRMNEPTIDNDIGDTTNNIVDININNKYSSHISRDINSPILIQYAQKCAWCGYYILCYQELETYNGGLKRYAGWLCHKSCNLFMRMD
jgi:hypothetical protein